MDLLDQTMAGRWANLLDQGLFMGGIDVCPVSEPSEEKLMYKRKRVMREGATKRYGLDGVLAGIEFTRREAECMVSVLKGHTNSQIAEYMGLSARTVEYYIQNMRRKVGAHSKVHLMKLVSDTGFLQGVDFV